MATPSKKKRGAQKDEDTILPETVSLDEGAQKLFQNKMKKFKRNKEVMTPGVVYVGNIPHGFYEQEMRGFFSQFGKILQLRLSRSKKTGGSKGYAFIKFQCEEVAKIVAETMNNYLMFEKLLKCQFMPEEKQHPDMFKGANRRFPFKPPFLKAKELHKKQKISGTTQRFLKKYKKRAAKLEKLGVQLEGSTLEKAFQEAKKLKDSNKIGETMGKKLAASMDDNSSQEPEGKQQTKSNIQKTPKSSSKKEKPENIDRNIDVASSTSKKVVPVEKTPVATEPTSKRKIAVSNEKTPMSSKPLSARKKATSVVKTPISTETLSLNAGSVERTPISTETLGLNAGSVERTPLNIQSSNKRKKSLSKLTVDHEQSSYVTPKNKKIKSVDVKTEPPKRGKSLVSEKSSASARRLKTPKSLSGPKRKKLSV